MSPLAGYVPRKRLRLTGIFSGRTTRGKDRPVARVGSGSMGNERGGELTRATEAVLVLIFRGTHQVLSAEKRLKAGGVPNRLIPVPRTLTSDCGLAIRIPLDRRDRAREILSEARMRPVSAHLPCAGGGYETVSL